MYSINGREDSCRYMHKALRRDNAGTVLLWLISLIFLSVIILLCAHIFYNGADKLFDLNFLTAEPESFMAGGGIGPEIFNSFYMLVLALAISFLPSLGAAIYLAEYAHKTKFTTCINIVIETLSAFPSIILGLFGFLLFVVKMGWGFSILSGAATLAIFNIPLMVRTIQQALESLPQHMRDAGLALGLTRWETIIHILLPAAFPAIITGIVLSAGRIFGEAAALIFTAGQSAPELNFMCFDFASQHCAWNIFRPAETLAVHIWKVNSECVLPDMQAISNGSAALLLLIVVLFNIIARGVGALLKKKTQGK